jgi:hypothetical protein
VLKIHVAAACALLLTSSLFAQRTTPPAAGTPAAAPRPTGNPLQVPIPHYVFIPMTIEVNAPVDKVWARVGKFCDIGEWSGNSSVNTCKITAGTDGEFGAVRTVGNEVMVGKTKYSYTYAAPPRVGVTYNLYHGTLEALPLTATTTRLNYTLVFDNSMLADDTARDTDLANRRTRFTRSLGNMKILAEGGTVPPPPPRPAGAPGGAAAPSGPGPAAAPPLNPSPHYVSIPMTIEVNAPVDKVWARIGKYCDIGEWGFPGCTITSGTDGEFGAVRSIGTEVLVGKTKYSYTYGQPLRTTGAYILYHGTLEAVALTPATTQINYTLFYDNSNLADDAARETDLTNRRTRFTGMLTNMKTLSEGGTLPPGAVGGGRGRGIAPARQ